MYVRNVSARLITINAEGASTQLKPGTKEPVKLTKAQASAEFTKSLLARDEIIEVSGPKEDTPDASGDASKKELQDQLTALGVDVDSRWGVERLQKEIDANLNG